MNKQNKFNSTTLRKCEYTGASGNESNLPFDIVFINNGNVLSIIGTAVNPFKDSYAVGYAMVYGKFDDFGPNFIPGLIYEVIKIVSMYFTIHYISKYKLNLQ